jgi:uncharacterized membrane protein
MPSTITSYHRQRIAWIDVAKGLAMILVFYGHLPGSGDNPWFPDLMGSREVVFICRCFCAQWFDYAP